MASRGTRRTVRAFSALSILAMAVPASADQQGATPPTVAQVMALSCAACHGPGGRSPGSIPGLEGRDPAFIATAMRAFRDGSRPATVMGRIATGYSDAEIDLLSRQFPAREIKQ